MHDGVGRIDIGDCDIRPPRQLHAIFPGKIEQRRQHHVRQLDRDAFHPVEGFAARQGFEHVGGSSADQGFKVDEVRGRDDRCHGAALRGMSRRVHPDKTNPLLPLGLIGDLDAAKFRTRRVICVVEFDREDVVITRHRPIRSERRGFAAMHRIVAAELGEQRPPGVVLIKVGIADVDRGQRAQRLGHRFAPALASSGRRANQR